MWTIFLWTMLVFSYEAFSACRAEFLGVVLDGFEDRRDGFAVYGVDVFFTLVFNRNEIAVEEGFEVVGNHALFLSECLCEFVYAHRFIHE